MKANEMAGFDLWCNAEEGEKQYVEHVREQKLSRVDRLVVVACTILLVVLVVIAFDVCLPSVDGGQDQKNSIAHDQQQTTTAHIDAEPGVRFFRRFAVAHDFMRLVYSCVP